VLICVIQGGQSHFRSGGFHPDFFRDFPDRSSQVVALAQQEAVVGVEFFDALLQHPVAIRGRRLEARSVGRQRGQRLVAQRDDVPMPPGLIHAELADLKPGEPGRPRHERLGRPVFLRLCPERHRRLLEDVLGVGDVRHHGEDVGEQVLLMADETPYKLVVGTETVHKEVPTFVVQASRLPCAAETAAPQTEGYSFYGN